MTPDSFIMCQDEHAVDHLEKELDTENLDLKNPPADVQESLLDALKSPENQGDQHISLLLQHPDIYSIEPMIVKHFIEAFYNILWDHHNDNHRHLTLRILEGHHQETAFIEIKNEEQCLVEHTSPVVPTTNSDNDSTYYINHLDAVVIRRAQLAKFFADKIALNKNGFDAERMT